MKVRSEESKRAVTYKIVHDGHEIIVTFAASCQIVGSAEAVSSLFTMMRKTLESEYGVSLE